MDIKQFIDRLAEESVDRINSSKEEVKFCSAYLTGEDVSVAPYRSNGFEFVFDKDKKNSQSISLFYQVLSWESPNRYYVAIRFNLFFTMLVAVSYEPDSLDFQRVLLSINKVVDFAIMLEKLNIKTPHWEDCSLSIVMPKDLEITDLDAGFYSVLKEISKNVEK